MMNLFLIFIVIPLQFAYSNDQNIMSAINFLEDVTKTIPEINNNEVQCSGNLEKKNDPYCDNLYEASCLKPDGKHLFENGSNDQNELLRKITNEARDKSAQEIGYSDFRDLISKKLKNSGLEIAVPATDLQWAKLFKENKTDDWSNVNDLNFVVVDKCKSAEILTIFETDNEKIKNFIKENQKLRYKFLADNIPEFINTQITKKCNYLMQDDSILKEDNLKIFSNCKNFIAIKSEAVNLFRTEGTPGYEAKAIAFVSKYIAPKLNYGSVKLNENAILKAEAAEICESLNKAMNGAAVKSVEQSLTIIAKAQPTIDYLIDKTYTAERKIKSDELMALTLSSIQNLLPSISNDAKKNSKIKDQYSKLKLEWLSKPILTAYEVDSETGLKVLIDKNDPYDKLDMFHDSHLEYFTELNAFYTPQLKNDEEELSEEMVHMMPSFLSILDTNSYSFLSVLAHEAGHKIGPRVSKINGYDLRPQWKDIIACYSSKDSIALVKGQEDETISDYISSMVLSEVLERLPFNERRSALKSSMTDFCLFDDENIQSFSVNCDHQHPENSLRVNGIYGANPKLRQAVGCNEPSSQFRSCTLKKGSL